MGIRDGHTCWRSRSRRASELHKVPCKQERLILQRNCGPEVGPFAFTMQRSYSEAGDGAPEVAEMPGSSFQPIVTWLTTASPGKSAQLGSPGAWNTSAVT